MVVRLLGDQTIMNWFHFMQVLIVENVLLLEFKRVDKLNHVAILVLEGGCVL